MKKIIISIIMIAFVIIMFLFPMNKSNAVSFMDYSDKYKSTYVVPYGKEIRIIKSNNESVVSNNPNIAIIDNDKLQIIGTGNFSITVSENGKDEKISFFAWNAYLKKGKYYTYFDKDKLDKAGILYSKTYLAVSRIDSDTLVIEDYFFKTGLYNDTLIGKYLNSYYDEKRDLSKTNYYEYSFFNNCSTVNFPEDSQNIEVDSIELNKTSMNLALGSSEKIIATVKPYNSSNTNISFSSDNTRVALINSDGVITGVGEGTTTIYARSSNGKVATCNVIVKKVSLSLNINSATKNKGETVQLVATTVPEGTVIWESSNSKIASVSSNGLVKALNGGTAIITAKCGSAQDTFKLEVISEKIHFVRLGVQADAILIESSGRYALVDTGNTETKSRNSLYNYLNRMGIKELDFIIITHSHYDHRGGVSFLLEKGIKVGTLYMKDAPNKFSKAEDLSSEISSTNSVKNICKKYNVPFVSPTENQVLKLNNIKITLYNTYQRMAKKTNLGPNGKFNYDKAVYGDNYATRRNDNSIVSLVECNGYKALLTGDLDNNSITKAILNKVGKLDVYKVAHHGCGGYMKNNGKRGGSSTKINVQTHYLVATNTAENAGKKVKHQGNGTTLNTYLYLRRNGKKITYKNILWSEEATVIINMDGKTISRNQVPVFKFKKSSISLKVGATQTIGVNMNKNTNMLDRDKELIWTSSDSKIVKVNSKGKITGVSKGTATITATSKTGNSKATCTVKVK